MERSCEKETMTSRCPTAPSLYCTLASERSKPRNSQNSGTFEWRSLWCQKKKEWGMQRGKILNSEERHWHMKMEGKIDRTKRAISPLILIVMVFDFVLQLQKNQELPRKYFSSILIFLPAWALFCAREADNEYISPPSALVASWERGILCRIFPDF